MSQYDMYDYGRPSQLHENAYTSRQLVGQGWSKQDYRAYPTSANGMPDYRSRQSKVGQARSSFSAKQKSGLPGGAFQRYEEEHMYSPRIGTYKRGAFEEYEKEHLYPRLGAYKRGGDYKDMTIYQLRDAARQQGISGYARAREPELIYALENGLKEVPYDMRDQGWKHEHGIGGRVGAYKQGGSTDFRDMTLYQLRDFARGKVPYANKNEREIIDELEKYYSSGHAPGYTGHSRVGQARASDDLEGMTVSELKAYAKENGMTGYSKLRKADLIGKIRDNMSGRSSSPRVGCGSCSSR